MSGRQAVQAVVGNRGWGVTTAKTLKLWPGNVLDFCGSLEARAKEATDDDDDDDDDGGGGGGDGGNDGRDSSGSSDSDEATDNASQVFEYFVYV
ncbi:hypothetical protein AWZ03_012076 [Drosophila navojoa]|uniref:Uncharacterized protein n=1 Tax=Drosophila navojoa TaxID=7232 RepID=A0A484AY21_DRONA|nr:hypothetical protein AWZ03_012076 [Drosophila navojoa]